MSHTQVGTAGSRPASVRPDGERCEPVEPEAWTPVVRWIARGLRRRSVRGLLLVATGGIGLVGLAYHEARTSWLQSRVLSRVARDVSFSVERGPSAAIRFPRAPDAGPYDLRLGYARLPEFLRRLEERGYGIDRQARSSPTLLRLLEQGVYPLYEEKTQAGLRILDRHGTTVFRKRSPERIYVTFDAIPPLVVDTLLFLENRELLDGRWPHRNPAVEWDRLARAALHLGARQLSPGVPTIGGSTLATQLEKARHSPDGLTRSVADKARQLATASLRAYLDGPMTLDAQRRIVQGYLNSLPLAARSGHGEVHGLGDGLWVWYGRDFDEVNRLLASSGSPPVDADDPEVAQAYRQVVSLLVAIRRPSDYLVRRVDRLARDTDAVLELLRAGEVIGRRLADRAVAASPALRPTFPQPVATFIDRKPVTATRAVLASQLGLDSLYGLDRIDLTIQTGVDDEVQREVTRTLRRLADAEHAAAAGLMGDRLLRGSDLDRVVYSLVLFERGATNVLRVRADNLDQPLDVSAATKLELGSTAKLRTLVTYLEVVAELHRAGGAAPATEPDEVDPLTRWVRTRLRREPGLDLAALLDAALDRRYSASPHERFFTGGGVHTFSNFDGHDNGRVLTVREAFHRSVNLVFVRLMRDIVRYHERRLAAWSDEMWRDPAHPDRMTLLRRFADREGTMYLDRFLRTHRPRPTEQAADTLATRHLGRTRRLAVIHRSVFPGADVETFRQFVSRHLPATTIDVEEAEALHAAYAPDRWSLIDRGYLARVHPLELWLVAELVRRPDATRSELLALSEDVRQEVYAWLFRTRYRSAQDRRIRSELERDAFVQIHRRWRRLGYPFDALVPSYATALGSSGDQPVALAELMGIIQGEGRRVPMVDVQTLVFAEDTPYETWMSGRPEPARPVLDPAVARAVRQALAGVVDQGTGRRIAGSFTGSGGLPVVVGGKTGTGDNRVRDGQGRTRRVLNRTAAFAFFIGDRLFGVLTAYVDGETASAYRFTSALPVQVLKHLAPVIEPLLRPETCATGRAGASRAQEPRCEPGASHDTVAPADGDDG